MRVGLLTFPLVVLIGGVLPASSEARKRAVSPHQLAKHSKDGGNHTVKGDHSELPIVNICSSGQVSHWNEATHSYVCCLPTACEPGYYIEKCSRNGEEDRCERCRDHWIQPNHTTSADTKLARCFPKHDRKHSSCPRDTKPHSGPFSMPCAYWCVCNTDKCFYGDPCVCNSIMPCGVNEEMDPDTNVCRACPWYAYKHVKGCQRCTVNITLWRQRTNEPVPTVKTTSLSVVPTNTTPAQDVATPEELLISEPKKPPGENGISNGDWAIIGSVIGVGILIVVALVLMTRGGLLRHKALQLVSKCLPPKPNGHPNTESTLTTPVSEQTILLADENTEPKLVDDKQPDTSIETVYIRTGEVILDPKQEDTQLVRQENPGFFRQNSVVVDAEVHSSSSSGHSSDLEEIVEDLAAPRNEDTGTSVQGRSLVHGSGASKPATANKGVSIQGNSFNQGLSNSQGRSFPSGEIQERSLSRSKTQERSLPRGKIQERSLSSGKTQERSLPRGETQDRFLSRGETQESNVDTGYSTAHGGLEAPVMMELHSVPVRGDKVSNNNSPSHNPGESGPQSLGERVVIGQSADTTGHCGQISDITGHCGQRMGPTGPRGSGLRLAMPTPGGGDVDREGRRPRTLSPIRLPESPAEFINGNRNVATVAPLSRVNETIDYYSGQMSYEPHRSGSSSSSDTSYFIAAGIASGSLDIANTDDFNQSIESNSSNNAPYSPIASNSENNPQLHVPVNIDFRRAGDGESDHAGRSERRSVRHDQHQTRVKQPASGPQLSHETFPKYVDTDNVTPKTVYGLHNNRSGNTERKHDLTEGKIGNKIDPFGVRGDEIVEVTKDSSSVAGYRKEIVGASNDFSVLEGETCDSAVVMQNLKPSDSENGDGERTCDTSVNDNRRGQAVEMAVHDDTVLTDGESLELPNNVLQQTEHNRSETDGRNEEG